MEQNNKRILKVGHHFEQGSVAYRIIASFASMNTFDKAMNLLLLSNFNSILRSNKWDEMGMAFTITV